MKKSKIYTIGFLTLLVFPIPAFLILYYFEGISPWELLQLDRYNSFNIGLGLMFGVYYAIFATILLESHVFKALPNRIEPIIKQMNLKWYDCLFLSICAGVGEEILFRSGVQFYLGPIITSIIFIAIHGYFNPKSWRKSLYGAILLPFILVLSYGYNIYGLGFCIAAHFSYDLYLFLDISSSE